MPLTALGVKNAKPRNKPYKLCDEKSLYLIVTPSDDPRVVKELQVTAYHVLWELVHVFFEQPGVLGPGVVT